MHTHLLCFSGDESADGLTEERGQQGVNGRCLLYEIIERVEQRLVSAHFIVDEGHITRQQLTCYVSVSVRQKTQVSQFQNIHTSVVDKDEHLYSLIAHFLLPVNRGLVCNEIEQLKNAAVLGEEEE